MAPKLNSYCSRPPYYYDHHYPPSISSTARPPYVPPAPAPAQPTARPPYFGRSDGDDDCCHTLSVTTESRVVRSIQVSTAWQTMPAF